MGPVRSRAAAFAVGVLLVTGTVAGCSSSEKSAEQDVCSARVDVQKALDKVTEDLKAGNFGDAKDALAGVKSAAEDLRSAVVDLADDEREELKPQVDQLRTDVKALTSANDLAALQTAAVATLGDLSELIDAIDTELSCSS